MKFNFWNACRAVAYLHCCGLDKFFSLQQKLLQMWQEEVSKQGAEPAAAGLLHLLLQHGQGSQAGQGVLLICQLLH